jgi:adhesin/invasin
MAAMMRRVACCLALAAAAAACHRPDAYLLAPQADAVLNVTLSATTLPADGISRASITAQLDPATDADKRTVTFTTTAGTLIADGKEAQSITTQADTGGKAVVELRSSTTPATARLDVTVATITRTESITFQQLTREQVFGVTVSATSIPADSLSTSVITVDLKRLGTLPQRAVKFETSLGTFISTGQTNSRSVTLTADSTGKAVAQLQSENVPGTARVRVTALDFSYEFEVAITQLAWQDVFDVSIGRAAIPADGFSTSVVTVTLKKAGTVAQRAVKFETSAGFLVAAGLTAARTVTVTADGTGRAQVELQSEKTVGTARVRITAFDVSTEFGVDFTVVNPASIITMAADPPSAPADGATPIIVSATIAASLPATRRTVTFRTTLGQLLPIATVDADGSNVARVSLVSTVTGVARVTATVDGVSAETTAQFTPALPDRLIVAPDAVTLKSGANTTIRVTLIRTTGSVSPRLEVTYSAVTSTGAPVGSFSRVSLADSAVSTAIFNVDTTTYVGPVTITASVPGAASGTATLQIIPLLP